MLVLPGAGSRARIFLISIALGVSQFVSNANAQTPQSIRAFVEQTLTLHPSVKAAEKAVDAARARRSAAAQYPYNPELEFGYENAEEATKEIGVSQTVEVWGKKAAREQAADAAVKVSTAALSLVRAELMEQLLIAVGELEKQRKRRTLAAKRLRLSRQFLGLTNRLAAAGDVGRAEVLSARTNMSNADLSLALASAELASAEAELIGIVGEQRKLWPVPVNSIDDSSFKIATVKIASVPEIFLARAELAVASASKKVADKEWLPDPTIGVRAGKDGEAELFGVSLSLPIPVWNRQSGERQSASEEALAQEFRVADTERRVRARLTGSESKYQASLAAVQKWRKNVAPVLRDQESLLASLNRVREINALDYLQQLNQLIETEALGIELEAEAWAAWIARLRAGSQTEAWLETLK